MTQRAASKDARKVLVIKFDGLTDFVLSMAAMKRIREAFPRAQITLMTTPPFAGLAKASPYFDYVEPQSNLDAMALSRVIKSLKFDRVFDLDTGKRPGRIKGWAWPFRPPWSLTPDRDDVHLLERHAGQLKIAGVWPDAPTAPGEAPPPDLSWIARKLPDQRPVAGATKPRPYVMMIPGGPEATRWPADHFGKVAQAMRLAGYDVVIVGQPDESAMARAIQKYDPKARDLTGRTDFSTIAALGFKAALAIGNEAGPTHLIAAAGAPTLAIFAGSADPAVTGPRGHVAILQGDNLAALTPEQVVRAAASLAPMPFAG
jgi:ADP-heptose:LPS heptosyltransferase